MKPDSSEEKRFLSQAPRRTWQEYQAVLKRKKTRKTWSRRVFCIALPLLILIASIYGFSVGRDGSWSFPANPPRPMPTAFDPPSPSPSPKSQGAEPTDIQNPWTALVDPSLFLQETKVEWPIYKDGKRYFVKTTLDASLQAYLNAQLDRRYSKQIAVVLMDPFTGRVLALAGYDGHPGGDIPLWLRDFPAASLFKIVTVSAVVEKHGFTPSTPLYYNGRKHTLYKSQLKNKRNKYTRRITLRDSFAQSINPVFGKLGVHYLSMSQIEKYARAFGFGEGIQCVLGRSRSRLFVSDKPYHLAEIASGFNRETTLSPLHGALIASVIANGGRFMAPIFIDAITNESHEKVYRRRAFPIRRVLSPRTVSVLSDLMQATVRSGTLRRAFRGYRRDKVLSKLIIGGKTGSISNREHTSKYDWFIGFAKEKKGIKNVAVSVLVVHGEKLGPRAGSYARLAIKAYFKAYFEGKSVAGGEKRRS